MPLLEVSLVFSKYTRQLTDALEVQARAQRVLALNPVRTLAKSLVNKMNCQVRPWRLY